MASSPAIRSPSPTWRSTSAWATPFQRALAEALRADPRGEVVSYGELAALAGRPRAARAAGAFCATNRFAFIVPCHRVVAADGIGGYGSTGVGVKRRLLALEGVAPVITSEDVREELATIAPQRECDRRAELSALFHSAGEPAPARGGRLGAPSRPRERRCGASGVRPPARERNPLRDPNVPPSRIRHARRATSCTSPATRTRCASSPPRVSSTPPRAARAAATACRRAELLPGGVPPRRVPRRRARSRSAARRTSSCARRRPTSAALLARLARAEGVELGNGRAARRTRSPTRRAGRRSSRSSRSWERPRPCSRSRSARSSPRRAARANRLANADHANLVRTSRSARRQLEAVERLRAGGDLETLPRRSPRGGGAPAPTSDRLAPRARRADGSARDEGGPAPPAPAARGARRDRRARRSGGLGSEPPIDSSQKRAHENRRRDGHSRRHQRVRPHRAELLPRAARARLGHRDRRAERPRRREDDGAPPALRLEPRPVPGRRRARRRRAARRRARRSGCSPSATRLRCRGATSASTSCSSRPGSSPIARARRSTSTPARRRSSSRRPATDPDVTDRARRQRRHVRPRVAPHRLERLVHDELRRAAREGAATTWRESSPAS